MIRGYPGDHGLLKRIFPVIAVFSRGSSGRVAMWP